MTVGTLYVASLPAGGPDDITLRALRKLQQAALVVAADPSRARLVLHACGVGAPLVDLASEGDPLSALDRGDVVLLLEGFAPGPPARALALIQAAAAGGVLAVPLPGSVQAVTALVVSGLPADGFVYLGELPQSSAARRSLLATAAGERRTLVAVEASQRLPSLVADLLEVLGNRPMAVVGATDSGEATWRGTVAEATAAARDLHLQGSCTLAVGGARGGAQVARWDESRLRSAVQAELERGRSARDVSRQLAAESSWPRREVYRLAAQLAGSLAQP